MSRSARTNTRSPPYGARGRDQRRTIGDRRVRPGDPPRARSREHTPTAGEADNLTILAKDASNDTVGTYSGTHSLIFEGAGEAGGEEPVVIDRSGVERTSAKQPKSRSPKARPRCRAR